MSRQAEITCPSGLRVKFRSIKGKDLDGLRDRQRLTTGEAITGLLDNCTIEVIDRAIYQKLPQFTWAEALMGDRVYAILGLRKATTGAKYDFDVRCQDSNCRRMIEWSVDLNDMPVKKLPPESAEVWLNGGNRYVTTVGDREVVFGLTTGLDQLAFVKKLNRQKQATPQFRGKPATSGERVLLSLAMQISSVEGLEPETSEDKKLSTAQILDWLDDLDLADITHLRKDIEAIDCGVETEIAVVCQHCGLTQAVELPLDSSFFAGA